MLMSVKELLSSSGQMWDIAPQVRLRHSTYASFPVNYLPVLLKFEAK
jgi:hypothetical protein